MGTSGDGILRFPGAFGGQVALSFDPVHRQPAGYVLVMPFYQGRLILTKHRRRGWEVPGGTVEPKEMPIQAAIRETYEETGAEIDAIEWIGQYEIVGEKPIPMIKSVYIARVARLHPLPPDFETEDVKVCEQPPDPELIKDDKNYSPILRDSVYPYVLKRIRELNHPFAR
ncbi:NUDIX hydrolase [Effusibacillus lacus]|uniref:Nucleoside triphosphatase n=1 Tax=Effusibacillus lacus TaxID=1348429 RepID=A0A292YGV6_9BACL|nr:NUDIX domain-containing protein [Effusibacillus lacus]TCS71260.1 8-oxo-dGTPase [Effusibacillus lacus]GAX89887.1 nucleoside triphosphatase [Effusibacillus lacus]